MDHLELMMKHFDMLAVDVRGAIFKLAAGSHSWIILVVALFLLAIVAVRTLYGILRFAFIYFLRPAKNLKFYGSWAVVTGASDGIGKAYCEELAKKGLNLVLISRTQSKLDDCASELSQRYKVQVKTCSADLCKIDEAMLTKISTTLNGLDVGLLINNAGSSYGHPEYLEQVDNLTDIDLITINTVTPTLLSKLVLPSMKERGRGIIVNIGSANGLLPAVPLLSSYAGTKAYIDQFSRSLDVECKKSGIRVQNQPPMFVATKMSKIRRARLDAPSPRVWAKAAVKQIGYENTLTPYWFHGLMMNMIDLIPSRFVSRHVLSLHLGFRAAYYRKQAKVQAAAAAEALDSAGKKSL